MRAVRGQLADAPVSPHHALLAGSEAEGPGAFRSTHLQVLHNHAHTPWRDAEPHAHRDSDELYVVLEGVMHIDVDGERHAVSANEFLAVPAGVVHQLVDVEVPHRSLVVRAPSVRDKLLPER